ncbi:energy-coupling factor transporter ATPase [Clostridium aminobutyricum]|uniref:energy-coupling factor transporter ATPase n=1 Tax=Clostridium aminobutyricum TaxID=33953 RepID=UPI001FD7173F|nr:energy-coupling factor transporter ATPase [Clostridium aminobutyricum]
MDTFTIKDLSFAFPEQERMVLKDIDLSIHSGQFVTICGASGCGKTTLLRHLKSVLTPHGDRSGYILFEGQPLEEIEQRIQSQEIGFVMQSPDNQIVTDKVWHELAFGLESLGYDTPSIRLRVAEMASFFGIETWFNKNTSELSGGQKQLLNLAAIMAMQPKVLVLDEPTSQLDPIAAADFLETVGKINRELGTTILITEHRLESVLPLSDRVIVMGEGQIIADGAPKSVAALLDRNNHSMFLSMPVPVRIFAAVPNNFECPVTVREGRQWVTKISESRGLKAIKKAEQLEKEDKFIEIEETMVELKEVWFRYERDLSDVVKGTSLKVNKGEIYALLGGNGTGKTTTLSLIAGIHQPYRGMVKLEGKSLSEMTDKDKFSGLLGVLPQNPQTLFVKKTLERDLYEMLDGSGISKEERTAQVDKVVHLCQLEHLLQQHPYDLSGGEQQRAALAKILLLKPRILLLDEPTKGLDGEFKQTFAAILNRLTKQGITVIMVSHDIEFCAKYAHRCGLFFDGNIVTEGTPNQFFSGNSFYTTAANRMARHLLPEAITAEQIISACGGKLPVESEEAYSNDDPDDEDFKGDGDTQIEKRTSIHVQSKRIEEKGKPTRKSTFSRGENPLYFDQIAVPERTISKRTAAAAFMILLLIPLTIFCGVYYLEDRKYYFISMLLILETMLPFAMVFESRKPQARELIVIAVLCAIGVAGRAAFFMIPQFKPVMAMVIIAGVAFGGETGFLVGAVTAFMSNMFFGQGPWTPWQMFGFGIVGFLAGILFRKGLLRRNKLSLSIFGGLATFLIYGGIMNPASVIMFQSRPTKEMFLLSYIQGVPFDLIHAASTVIFLWAISQPMLEKLDRIKLKYGLIE